MTASTSIDRNWRKNILTRRRLFLENLGKTLIKDNVAAKTHADWRIEAIRQKKTRERSSTGTITSATSFCNTHICKMHAIYCLRIYRLLLTIVYIKLELIIKSRTAFKLIKKNPFGIYLTVYIVFNQFIQKHFIIIGGKYIPHLTKIF